MNRNTTGCRQDAKASIKSNQNKSLVQSSVAALALAGALSAPLASAQDDPFQLSEKLSVTGFIDMSWTYVDPDEGGSEQSFGLDQFEIDFIYDFDDKLTAQVDLEYQDNGTGEETDIEQAFINYALTDQFSITAGRFLSYTGWETEEPTGLFQFSGTGYAAFFYGGYQQGVSGLYKGKGYTFALSIVNDLGDLEGEARDSEQPGYEFMAAFNLSEEVTFKGFYSQDKLDGTDETITLVNLWASYAAGPVTLAVEYNTSENAPAGIADYGLGYDADGYLLMGNYAWDKVGLTLRYHSYELDGDASDAEFSAITISPSITVSENLLFVFEARFDEIEEAGQDDRDETSFAVEALITF